MKKLFYFGVIGIILFEIANVYFIMPMPGSQRMRSIEIAYYFHTNRWFFRGVFGLLTLVGFYKTYNTNKWLSLSLSLVALGVIYAFNFRMAADHMFYQPTQVLMKSGKENKIKGDKLILGIEQNGEARAYPIQFIGYHHQVLDTLAGKPIMVTYCTVCRTGRIFEPLVNGKHEIFRLVGMDHFNAMFEDQKTKSWWRQANGEALIGQLKGTALPELDAQQMELKKWLKMYPNSKILQPDTKFQERYEKMEKYELGKGNSELTQTDSLSWKEKSWVVGIIIKQKSKAFDWNRLKKERIINENVGNLPIVLALSNDNKSFVAFARPSVAVKFSIKNDSLISNQARYDFKGNAKNQVSLQKIKAYQEFWHSWQTFHPETEQY